MDVLRRRVRKDAGRQGSMGEALRQALLAQYAAHRGWSVQLHYDNLAALAKAKPEIGAPSYSTVRRGHGVAVAVVHHAKKGGGHARAGQALRGSSEFHAWGHSNLYLRRQGDDLTLTVEHRAAPSVPAVALELAQLGDALAVEVVERGAPDEPAPTSVDERITRTLARRGRGRADGKL